MTYIQIDIIVFAVSAYPLFPGGCQHLKCLYAIMGQRTGAVGILVVLHGGRPCPAV